MKKNTIFIVEDEVHLYSTLNIILKRAGYSVVISENGLEALKKINYHIRKNLPIDLILTDIIMPEMDGFKLIHEINKFDMNIPCIVITGHGNKDMLTELSKYSYAGYLEKPIEKETLLNEVSHVLKFSKWCKEL
jgi:DNA-binding NtrC family response regulator